ncbi:hypothetical protein [Mucilaginibacter sp.]|jgi:hypothetical protein|uniref:hypothetical protein n=1 Tax=Mucilaginibacter sp. TaxID=1882438 RepID=UPI0025EED9F7|nr:hypothetical protein [Mucilaginibacter sp.]
MKKNLLALVVLLCAVVSANAQSFGGDADRTPRLSAGFGAGGTIGSHSGDYPAAGSVDVKLEFPIASSPVSITASAAYTFFVSKDGYYFGYNSNEGNYSSGSLASFAPVMLGARVYAGKLFFEGAAGASFNLNSNHSDYTSKTVALVLSPSIGYGFRFGSSQKFGLDLSLAYETRLESNKSIILYNDGMGNSYTAGGYGNYNQIACHVAFSLGL